MIQFSIEGAVGKIILDRTEKFNSFNSEMAKMLQGALKKCESKAVRCVYLGANGKAFSAGQDLSAAAHPQSPGIQQIVEEQYNPIILGIRNLEKPVVCAVNGVAAGAGANIALACDIVLAGRTASFIQAFSKIGLVPDSGGTFFLPRLIGMQRAGALMMLGEKVEAAEAQAMGMIYKMTEDDALEQEAWKIALALSEMPTIGIALTKKLLNSTFLNSLQQQLTEEGSLQAKAGETEDFKEGVKAFLEKRKPVFNGQ